MKLFTFFAAALAQDFNETDSRMYGAQQGQQGSAIDGCQGPLCVAAVQGIQIATDELNRAQEAATQRHETERAESQARQQALQAAFEAKMEQVRLEFEDDMAEWQRNHTEMNEDHQDDWEDYGNNWAALNDAWGTVDWSQ